MEKSSLNILLNISFLFNLKKKKDLEQVNGMSK